MRSSYLAQQQRPRTLLSLIVIDTTTFITTGDLDNDSLFLSISY